MPTQLINSQTVVQVFGPTLAEEAEFCTFQSFPSGSVLIRTVPEAAFQANSGKALLDSLGDAVESILGEGIAVAATGTQGLDESSLIFDAVTFTVEYVPPAAIPGRILGEVQVPVYLLTLDTAFGGFITGPTAAEMVLAEYNRLKALAGG